MHAPAPTSVADDVVVVLPDACVGHRTQSMLTLVRWLTAARGTVPTVVCWQSGPLVGEFGALARTVDAGQVNRHRGVRLLTRVRLKPLARRLKTAHLRRLLAPLAHLRQVLLVGMGTAAYLDWLPPDGDRTVVLWLDADDAPTHDDADKLTVAARLAAAFLVADDEVAKALADLGVPLERLHRVGEPVIDPGAGGRPVSPPRTVAIVGARPHQHEAVAELVAATSAAFGAHDEPAVAWVHDDLRRGWTRWTDDAFAGLEGRVADWSTDNCRNRLDQLAALVVLAPEPGALAVEAAVAGVPVLDLGGAGEPVSISHGDVPALVARLGALAADPNAWLEASRETRFRAASHDVGRVGDLVLEVLGRPDR